MFLREGGEDGCHLPRDRADDTKALVGMFQVGESSSRYGTPFRRPTPPTKRTSKRSVGGSPVGAKRSRRTP